MKNGIKPGFFSWTEDHGGRTVLPQTLVGEGSHFFLQGTWDRRERKKKKGGTPGQLQKNGLFATGDEAWFEARCSLEENVEGRKDN